MCGVPVLAAYPVGWGGSLLDYGVEDPSAPGDGVSCHQELVVDMVVVVVVAVAVWVFGLLLWRCIIWCVVALVCFVSFGPCCCDVAWFVVVVRFLGSSSGLNKCVGSPRYAVVCGGGARFTCWVFPPLLPTFYLEG